MRRQNLAGWLLVLGVAAAPAYGAEQPGAIVEVGPAVFHAPAARAAVAGRASRVFASSLPEAARHALGPLSAAQREDLRAPDQRGGGLRPKKPAIKVGLARALPEPIGFNGVPAELSPEQSRALGGGLLERSRDGKWTWTAEFSAAGAGGLRLHLRRAALPQGSRVFVYSASGETQGPYSFDAGSRPEGFWTNTIFGDEIFLQVEIGFSDQLRIMK